MKKKYIITLSVLAAVFLLLLTMALLGKFVWGWFDDPEEPPHIQPDLELGEAYYYLNGREVKDRVLMFPQLERFDLFRIRVRSTKGENYFFLNTQTPTQDYFLLGECDEEGNFDDDDLYSPPIQNAINGFMYSSLYDDATKIPKMLAAVGTLSIQERIRPEGGGALTQEFLAKYGLAQADSPAYFELLPYARDPENDNYLYTPIGGDGDIIRLVGDKYYYIEENPDYDETVAGSQKYIIGEEYTDDADTLTPAADTGSVLRVYVGNATVDDSGYYVYLEGRDVVYTTTSNYLADVVNKNIGYYIAPQLVTNADTNYSHMITPGFTIRDGNFVSTVGAPVSAGATVGITTEQVHYMDSNGGQPTDDEKNIFQLLDLASPGDLEPFVSALTGKAVGDAVDVIIPKPALAKLGESVSYHIFRVRGILKGTEYLENTGDVLTGNEKIVVAYTDGTMKPLGAGQQAFYGYIDLGASNTPAALRNALIGRTVSETIYDDIDIPLTYDGGIGDTLMTFTYKITAITEVVTSAGERTDTVDYGTTVTFTYRLFENDEFSNEGAMQLMIPVAGDADGQFGNDKTWTDMAGGTGQGADKLGYLMKRLAEGLLGKETGSTLDTEGESTLEIAVPYVEEIITDYHLYENAKVEYVMNYTESLSFAFKNDPDIFYGSSLYEIDKKSDKAMYSLDATATNEVLNLFRSLSGDETVAVGIDDQTINKYGLYAYHLRFVMPYSIYTRDVGEKTFYYPEYEISYDLYISAVQKDGSRYVASTQYDTVVRVDDGSTFDFLEWSFSAKWMQNSLLLVSYQYLRRMVFDLNFSDADGEDYNSVWGFDITVDPKYKYPTTSIVDGVLKTEYEEMARLYAAVVKLGAHTTARDYDALKGLMQYTTSTYDPTVDNRSTVAGKLARVVTENIGVYTELANAGWRDLDAVYGDVLTSNKVDKTGSDNLRQVLRVLNAMRYSGEVEEELTDAEIATLMSGDYTMRLALTLLDQRERGTEEHGYTFTFYNYGMNALVVVEDDKTGTVSSLFYVRSREVVKLAQLAVDLAYGRDIDPDKY